MTESSVSFAGNLTDNPELRHTEGGITQAMLPGGRVGAAGPGAVVLHRDRVTGPGRARGRDPGQGQPGRGRGRG
jgi:hypothetical protein